MMSTPGYDFDLIQTIAIAAIVYMIGVILKRKFRFFERLNIPAAVLGGLLFAIVNLILHNNILNIKCNTAMQSFCMVLFFTSIGTNASLSLLKKGGKHVVVFMVISSVFCLIQNFTGIGIASLFGISKLFGVMAGSVTLVGGPATGLAFSPMFEEFGLKGAETIAITSATFGIVFSGLIGGPVGTFLIQKFRLRKPVEETDAETKSELMVDDKTIIIDMNEEHSDFTTSLINTVIIMGLGGIISLWIAKTGITLPAYIGAMIVGAVVRNVNDKTQWITIDQKSIDFAGDIALNIFITVALMDLKLWELFHLAIPLSVILIAQVVVVLLFALVVAFPLTGKDYDSAVIASGFVGFMLGTTANAMAVMKTIVAKYGAAPRAFLVVPLVGAFFIDYFNSLLITIFLNFLK